MFEVFEVFEVTVKKNRGVLPPRINSF